MKTFADKRRTNLNFDVGDLVWVRLQPYKQNSVRGHSSYKLSSRFFGLFLVIEKIGVVAYKLQLPNHAKVHPVFNVSKLKKFVGDSNTPPQPLPIFSEASNPIL